MKTFTIVAILVTTLGLILSGCSAIPGLSGASAPNGPSGAPASGGGFSGQGGGTLALPGLTLAAGMLKLDGTPYGVTAQEATQLLPLWQSLQKTESSLPTPQAAASGTPRPRFDPQTMQEITTQLQAIESAMPSDQLQAIEAMNLNRQDVVTILQQDGITMGTFGQGGSGFRPNGGTFTPPGGTPEAQGTPRAFGSGGRQGFGGFLPPAVVNGIVKYLQTKARG